MNEQDRYLITDGKGRFAVKSTGTVHLSQISNWVDVCVYKEYNTAKKALEKSAAVLRGCEVKKFVIRYEEPEEEEDE